MRPAALWLALLAAPAAAHVMSMSTGDLTIEGARAHYQLRMPLYEIRHVNRPEQTLLEHIRFGGARLADHQCRSDPARDLYLCTAAYEWPAPVARIDVECTLAAITVPNHVHLLRAQLGGNHDQAVFDIGFTRATLRFRPPARSEILMTQSGAGFVRALSGVVQLVFLAALALAARSRRELLALAGMFIAGEIASVAMVPRMAWYPAPRFVEAAGALTIAYLAVEILLLPKSGSRWLVAGLLGAVHGLYFSVFVAATQYSPALVLTGAAIAEIVAIAFCALVFWQLRRWERILAGVLGAFGLVWFVVSVL
jgi:hypothetical protein